VTGLHGGRGRLQDGTGRKIAGPAHGQLAHGFLRVALLIFGLGLCQRELTYALRPNQANLTLSSFCVNNPCAQVDSNKNALR
jgi:hypothetical protein